MPHELHLIPSPLRDDERMKLSDSSRQPPMAERLSARAGTLYYWRSAHHIIGEPNND